MDADGSGALDAEVGGTRTTFAMTDFVPPQTCLMSLSLAMTVSGLAPIRRAGGAAEGGGCREDDGGGDWGYGGARNHTHSHGQQSERTIVQCQGRPAVDFGV